MSDRTELCLFLSSTFLDMMPEREYLVKHLLPELRQICRERGVILTEIDLRWGITERQARRGKIVSVCLEEILRRRPLILAFVGDRYGWCPAPADLNDAPFLDRYPWIGKGVNEGKSLVELETLEVARNDPAMRERIRFYFKHGSYVAPHGRKGKEKNRGNEDDIAELRRLRAFHRRVRESGLSMREGYRTPAQLGEWIREDVLAVLDSLAPDVGGFDSWIARERYGHEAYAATRRRAYIDHVPTLQALDRYVESPQPENGTQRNAGRVFPLVVTGESGAGKSALLARWSERYRRRNPDAFLIEHYVGATPSGADRFALMRRIMAEIRERYGLAEELPALPEQIVENFPSWLARVRGERLVLVIDALDRLDGAATALASFPLDYAPQIRLLLSTTPGPVLDLAGERGWESLQVHPLAETDRRKAIRAYLAEFSKRLEPEQVRRIATDGKSANPLYLRTSLEELRIHGEHETLNVKIDHYLSAVDPRALFGLVLERIENDFGKGLTSAAMSCLWASRSGLSEFELAGLLDVPPLKLRPLIGGMEHHLTRIDGRLNFCHDHLRNAVAERYLPSRVRRRNFHRRIAAWFSTQPVSPRRAEEEPWQWRNGEDPERLLGCLTDPLLFLHLNTGPSKYSLLHFWRGLGKEANIEEAYRVRLEEFEKNEADGERVARLWKEAGEFVILTGHYEGAIRLLRRGCSLADRMGSPLFRGLFLGSLGRGLTESGDYADAEKALQDALAIYRDAGQSRTADYADLLGQLGSLYYYWKRYAEAESTLNEALKIRNGISREDDPVTARIIGGLAAVFSEQLQFGQAEMLLRHELLTLEKCFGGEHPDVATCLNNLGTLYARTEEYEKSIEYFERACSIYEYVFGAQHPSVGRVLANLSYVLRRMDQYERAEYILRKAIEIDRDSLGEYHPAIAQKMTNLGTLLKDRGFADKAEQSYREALKIRERIFGADHVNTAIAWLNVAVALKDQKKLNEARELYEQYLPVKLSALGSNHPSVKLSAAEYSELVKEIELTEQVQ